MHIALMTPDDIPFVRSIDPHATTPALERRLFLQSCYILREDSIPVGLLHYTLIWDSLPFLNLLFLLEAYRGKGLGRQAMAFWEQDMKRQGYQLALLSTQVNEDAQHFYRKIGYTDCGGLLFSGTPHEQPMEMFMRKIL